ncbi:Sodium/potassium/calcium exchanger 3 [Channa argus]|uniref:Sodium/potassium/calcium exchanger 3 n=1 Tax=Channa argus TaxID=215402 RepID=A0A6G1R1B8_CHAAH|nr:Sodium/potassium/calcium exchanger 3 [Channa argus]
MTRAVVEGMTETDVGGGGMLNRLRSRARRRKRKELFSVQMCFAGVVLGLVVGLQSVSQKAGYYASSSMAVEESRWESRHLLQQLYDNESQFYSEPEKNCTEPAIHEFPRDYFTNQERTEGAVGLHVLCAVYMFYALALVCDDYFVPSLEKICEFIYDEKVVWWEALTLILMYFVYILIMKFNSHVVRFLEKRKKNSSSLRNGAARNTELDDGCDATAVLLKKANHHRKTSVLMVDELLSGYPHQLSFSEAGMRIMITSHFSPRTRLTMASRMLITERQRLINTQTLTNGDSDVPGKGGSRWGIENGLSGAERVVNIRHDVQEAGNETENEDNENNENDEEEEEEDGEGPFVPFQFPDTFEHAIPTIQVHEVLNSLWFLSGENDLDLTTKSLINMAVLLFCQQTGQTSESTKADTAGACNKLKWVLGWPLCLLLYFTIPNCSTPCWENWFMLSFVSSTLWIAAFSYIMVWMVTVIGFTLGIPDVIMGMGDMAVSNSIGSNVFDILVGLGLPWALKTLAINYGSDIKLNSKGLIFSVGLLLASVFLTVLGVHLNKWTLDKRLGLTCLLLYSVFLCFSCLIEYNIFKFVNLPTCRDD